MDVVCGFWGEMESSLAARASSLDEREEMPSLVSELAGGRGICTRAATRERMVFQSSSGTEHDFAVFDFGSLTE